MKNFLSVLNKYSQFQERASRNEYWCFVLVQCMVFILIAILDVCIGSFISFSKGRIGVFYLMYAIATFLPMLAVTVRRLHDTGRGFWYVVLYPLFPFTFLFKDMIGQASNDAFLKMALGITGAGNLYLFVLLCLKGESLDNEYGKPIYINHQSFNNIMNPTQPESPNPGFHGETRPNDGNFGASDPSQRKTVIGGDNEPDAKSAAKNLTALAGFLISFSKNEIGEFWELREGNNTIGTSVENQIVLGEQHVSSKHAIINISKDAEKSRWRFQMVDLSATNTTELNGVKQAIYTGFEIRNLDRIKVGEYEMVLFTTDKFEHRMSKNELFSNVSPESDYSSRNYFNY